MRVSVLTRGEILESVAHLDWQKYRLSLKGLTTREKLRALSRWRRIHKGSRQAEVQTVNYINALLRGGQLFYDANGRILQKREK